MKKAVQDKLQRLQDYFKQIPAVAIAYSGGVDSTVVSYVACRAKGCDQVLLLLADSCLMARQTCADAERVIHEHFPDTVKFVRVPVHPSEQELFLANDRLRCYYCKSMVYQRLLDEARKHNIFTLADGTNCDDLQDERPGLQAARELGIRTPLVDTGFRKEDVRTVADHFRLPNARLPSDSCLATRISRLAPITEDKLLKIERMEAFLKSLGFSGCRVRLNNDRVVLEFTEHDWPRLAESALRVQISAYFRTIEDLPVSVDLSCRR